MSSEIHLGSSVFGCSVDALRGARLSSLRINAHERLLTYTRGATATSWGAFPMVPYAGRVRDGRFSHDGVQHQLPRNIGDHAIHGTVFDTSWSTLEQSSTRAVFVASLGRRWPYHGSVTHEIVVDATERVVSCTLTVTTTSKSMPAQVGWHPWFVRPANLGVDFTEMYVRDEHYIPRGRRVPPTPPPWDDCFIGSRRNPEVSFPDGARVTLESDCDHWVIYDMPKHALCIEPQSGPPDGFTLAPHIVTPDKPLRRTMKLICR